MKAAGDEEARGHAGGQGIHNLCAGVETGDDVAFDVVCGRLRHGVPGDHDFGGGMIDITEGKVGRECRQLIILPARPAMFPRP